ncbi:12566_t:CDS:1, partial [Acaulospora colombiana]
CLVVMCIPMIAAQSYTTGTGVIVEPSPLNVWLLIVELLFASPLVEFIKDLFVFYWPAVGRLHCAAPTTPNSQCLFSPRVVRPGQN